MEKYGTVPKRFTKAWWEYFWDYYKWHVIGGGFILCLIIITIVQVVSKVDYDAVVTYAGEVSYSETSAQEISAKLAEVIPDMNENGRTDVQFQVLPIIESKTGMENAQYTMAMETKKVLEIQTGESFLFIVDENQARQITDNDLAEGTFLPAEEWLGKKDTERAPGEAGAYFVKIPSAEFFKEYQFLTNDIYIGIRSARADEDAGKAEKGFEAAVEIADYLLGV